MSKYIKRFISTMLVACMAMSMVAGAAGTENSNNEEETLNMLVSSMVGNQQQYGLEIFNPTSFKRSDPINCYEVDNGVAQKAQIKLFPIFSGDLVVAMVTATYDNGMLVAMQGATTGVDILNQFLAKHDKVAAVFNEDSVYYYNGRDMIHAWSYFTEAEYQSIEVANIDLSGIEFTDIYDQLFTQMSVLNQSSASTYASVKISGYPARTQALTLSCWAACAASLIEYFKDTVYSDYAIYSAIDLPFNNQTGGNITMAIAAIEALGYTAGYYVKPFTNFQYSQIKEHIYANNPVMMGMAYSGTQIGHAVVCMGFNDTYAGATSSGTIEIMNPANASFVTIVVNRVPDSTGSYFSYQAMGKGELKLNTYSHINIQ